MQAKQKFELEEREFALLLKEYPLYEDNIDPREDKIKMLEQIPKLELVSEGWR